MEKEALATVAAANNQAPDAVAFWPWEQEVFPYFTNRLGPMANSPTDYSEDIESYGHTVIIRLVVDHWSAGFKGDKADLAYQYIVAFETYFRNHPMLTTDPTGDYPDDPDYLFEDLMLTGHTGLVIFQNAGQYGCEFTLSLPYLRDVDN
jgi:hypothetical protein